ncbi:hypothetical protein FMEXI_320 [Fusarium mexicanum]|uniref:Uncharacterized protein n=1 Tax=Fusarium mexicanum TaxID=751941 RepID=A0A8H5JN73_9HYPO|nr:hypothetical protein FMEXI_320 [Fusarium mexicanum]
MVSGALAMPVAAPNGGTINYAGLKGAGNPHPGPYKPRSCLPSRQYDGRTVSGPTYRLYEMDDKNSYHGVAEGAAKFVQFFSTFRLYVTQAW